MALGAALLLGAGTAQAGVKYLGDGAIQNSRGGWDLPKQGACPADATAKTRPECIARRYTAASSTACTALGAAGTYSWSTGVCNDLVNMTQARATRRSTAPERGRGVCAIVMQGDDRTGRLRQARRHPSGPGPAPPRGDAALGGPGVWRRVSSNNEALVGWGGRSAPLPQQRDPAQRPARPRHRGRDLHNMNMARR
jgi:hypothetical protein